MRALSLGLGEKRTEINVVRQILLPPIEVDAAIIFWTRTLPDTVLQTSGRSRVEAVRKDSKDD